MFLLVSERLRLLALNYNHLQLLAESRNSLEKSLGLAESDFVLSADDSFLQEFHEMIPGYFIPKVEANPENYQWFTHWLIVEKSSQLTVGGIGASGLPDENGEVMIGYFIDMKSEGYGYATEAVKCFAKWLFKNPSLKTIIADTPENHIASQKVLQKCGFSLAGKVEEGFHWKLESSHLML